MLSLLSRFSSTAIMWAVIAVVGVLSAAVGTQTVRLWLKDAELSVALSDADQAKTNASNNAAAARANASNLDTLREDLASCIGDAKDIEKAETAAKENLATVSAERARLADALKREREKRYAEDPACALWGSAALCPAVSDGLRAVWRAGRSGTADQAGPVPGTPVGAGAGVPDRGAAVAGASDPGSEQLQADCYSNAQLYDAFEAAVNWGGGLAVKLDAVRTLSDEATAAPDTGTGNAKQ